MEMQIDPTVTQLNLIGKSNNSHLYKELDKQGQKIGCLKMILHQEKDKHAKECAQLHNEFQILSKLNHANIISIKPKLHNGVRMQKNELCCIEMELADRDLFDKMSHMYPNVLEPIQIRSMFLQIAKALEYLHERNITHNDIKLENFLVFEQTQTVKLADFGFACQGNMDIGQKIYQWTKRSKSMMAPEFLLLFKGQEGHALDEKKSDVWALGVTLFQCMLLRTPFIGKYASSSDIMFKDFYNENYNEYWKQNDIVQILLHLDKFEDCRKALLMDLMNKMLCVDPQERLDISQVVNHPWFASKSA